MGSKHKTIKKIGSLVFGILVVSVAIWAFLFGYAHRSWEGEFGTGVIISISCLLLGLPFIIIPYTKFGKRWEEEAEKDRETMMKKQAEEAKRLEEEKQMFANETPAITIWELLKGISLVILVLIVIVIIIAVIWFILKGLYGLLLFGVRQI